MIALARLRYVREHAALTQRELAARSKVTESTIVRLERGLQQAQPPTLRKLAKALGVSPADLIGDET